MIKPSEIKKNKGIKNMIKSIQYAMIDKGINKKQLAEISGINTQSLYNCFSLNRLSMKTAKQIAAALNCEIVLQDKETGKIY